MRNRKERRVVAGSKNAKCVADFCPSRDASAWQAVIESRTVRKSGYFLMVIIVKVPGAMRRVMPSGWSV